MFRYVSVNGFVRCVLAEAWALNPNSSCLDALVERHLVVYLGVPGGVHERERTKHY